MAAFVLDPRLAADTVPLGRFALSLLRLRNDATWPWCILVPRRAGVRELFELSCEDRAALIEEAACVGAVMRRLFAADKLNIGALGNIVEQLHVHIVVRHRADPAWPGPVWGHPAAGAYADAGRREVIDRLQEALAGAALAGGFAPDAPDAPAEPTTAQG